MILLDNGSRRAAATLNLRRLAQHLSERLGTEVHPVSALHSSKIPPEQLGGEPAWTLEGYLDARAAAGERSFEILPLFFGPSRAIGDFIPEVAGRVAAAHGPIEVRIADVLCPLPAGEPRLADILADNVTAALGDGAERSPTHVLLVDHGSPLPAVTAVRHWLAERLTERLGAEVKVGEAVMERREGADYDFNGRLLAEVLADIGSAGEPRSVVLAMQFISPGRHAGAGGDIDDIAAAAAAAHLSLDVQSTRLIGEHPLFVDILADRAAELPTRPAIVLTAG
ncbi:sirohydrochlorin chelatase [Thiohalocapsa sp. ML1]|jgi:sirohydrochlorin ferrochelatase|uniref:sirohydrochlorin chelatase n=1 Tax=Thiohalocapsa sp. ML1 TaxID=1431688 RepID=UPI000732156A|nr:CbiX/SirB N-terminal domain-containing protein [Thiohalocapsa sp. ML1]